MGIMEAECVACVTKDEVNGGRARWIVGYRLYLLFYQNVMDVIKFIVEHYIFTEDSYSFCREAERSCSRRGVIGNVDVGGCWGIPRPAGSC